MKNQLRIISIFVTVILLCSSSNVFSQMQPQPGNFFVVTTFELAFPKDGTIAEFDSLNQLYTDKVIKKNELIVSHKTLRHAWGSNNRDFVVVTEVKSWEDIEKAADKSDELFEQAWSTKEARKAYNDAYNKYFTGKHSDQIFSEVKSGRK